MSPKFNRRNAFASLLEAAEHMKIKEKVDLYGGKDPRDLPDYGISEAAHYLQLPRATLRSWVLGQPYTTQKGPQFFAPLIDLADKAHRQLSFFNLVEAHVLSALRRKHRVSLSKVRAALDYLKKHFPSKHPLADQEFETDGSNVFLQRYGELITLSADGQLAIREMLQAHLRRIERDPSGLAIRLYLFTRKDQPKEPKTVLIDPRVAFGRPVLVGTNIATKVISQRFKAGEFIEELADDYSRSPQEIQEAIRFEQFEAA
jgi:uncharacterized protein (DUF433 family)